MMEWVLIIFIYQADVWPWKPWAGVSIEKIEFESFELCRAAKDYDLEYFGGDLANNGVRVVKYCLQIRGVSLTEKIYKKKSDIDWGDKKPVGKLRPLE
jgi:hypothetical protein